MLTIGINFRGTAGFVTDGTNETYARGSDTYPTTRGGATYGWLTAVSAGDLNAGSDRRLAGMNYFQTTTKTFQLDLPAAGDYLLSLALGAQNQSNGPMTATVKDTAATVLTIGPHTPATAHFFDASDTDRTEAAWPGSQVSVQKTFATTTLLLVMSADPSMYWTIAHLFVSQVAAANVSRPIIGGGYY